MRPVLVTSLIALLVASACASSQPTDTKRERLTEPSAGEASSSDEPEEPEETADKVDKVELALLESAVKDPKRVTRGKELYAKTCSACHRAQAQGLIGPNLTDEHWLHGGDLLSIYETIYHGVPDRGCPSWGASGQIARDDIVALVAFVDSVRGSNPDNAKSPEGER
ncbi:MAG: c-type cytochrome, partial [Myxococcota bacterium]